MFDAFDFLYVYSTRWSRFHLTLSVLGWQLIGIFYYIPDFPNFNGCAHIQDFMHIGRIILYSVFGAI